jgi:HPt (histidine-containing phosphotransfer) domain-containing protein
MVGYRDAMIMSDALVKRAQHRLKKMGIEFSKSLPKNLETLSKALKENNRDTSIALAYSIKSIAAPLGWPLISKAADLLWRVLPMVPAGSDLHKEVFHYFDTIDVLVREQRSTVDERGRQLVGNLQLLYEKNSKDWTKH